MNLVGQPWNVVFFVGFVVYVVIRGRFMSRTKANENAVSRVDGVEKVLIAVVSIGTMVLPLVYLFTTWLGFADYVLPASAPWIGTGVMTAALWLFWRSHADLGLNWSMTLEVRKGHELVRNGVYRRMRHPMYAAILLFGVAQALMLPNWLAGFSAIVTFLPMYIVRTPREEAMMLETFGAEYEAYMRETWRVFPKPRK